LEAAERVVLREGAAALTLDSVSKEANSSKGGLTHHFPTRDALVLGLAQRMLEEFVGAVDTARGDASTPGAWTRAYLECSFDEESRVMELYRQLHNVLPYTPELMEVGAQYFRYVEERVLADGLPLGRALTIVMACEGVSFPEPGFARPHREEVQAELRRLLDEAIAGAAKEA